MDKVLIILIFLLIPVVSFSQEVETAVLVGDRPDQTESAFIVPRGYFQVEDGFSYENVNDQKKNITYSSMLLRYGVFDHFELRFAADYTHVQQSMLKDFKGLTPLSVGGKIHVHQEKGWIPQIAFIGEITIANTGSSDFVQKYNSTSMLLTFGHSLPRKLSIGYSIAIEFPEDVPYSLGKYTFVTGYSITEKIGAFIEVYGIFSKYQPANNLFNGGVTYLIHPNIQLDFAGGFGLSQNAANNYFTFGMIYLFKPS
ncbi:MAG: transporter [Bacteroidales bacterium]|jgi:hypothetical protein|nr:transporter [Bacteroidales bacterium]